ncbi:EpsG family protein [uncultured Parabacteroides sp.]|uniref:EpsG family protein n=1 Tax=uncultured Parabacteroides sp. TaxID=512312 RepID=UPI00261A83A4|nr:EpsG family protein [uncultured Parabacteroides sp.]
MNKVLKVRFFYFISFIQLFLLRSYVEPSSIPDLTNYYDWFELTMNFSFIEILRGDLIYLTETGYLLLCKFCSIISESFTFFLSVVSIIWISCYFIYIKKYSPMIMLSVIILLVTEFHQSLFVLRQHLAMAILLLSYPSIIERNLKKFIFISIIAISIHTTALVFIPIYFIYGIITDSKKFIIAVVLLAFIIFLLFKSLDFLNLYFGFSYDNYINGARSGRFNLTTFFISSIYFSSYYFFLRNKIFESGINRLITAAMIICILISFFGTSLNITGRLIRYYNPAILLLTPIVATNMNKISLKIIYIVAIVSINIYITFIDGAFIEFISSYKLNF